MTQFSTEKGCQLALREKLAHHWHSAQAIRFVPTTHLDLPVEENFPVFSQENRRK